MGDVRHPTPQDRRTAMKLIATAAGVCVSLGLLAGCGSDGGATVAADKTYVDGATFTLATPTELGKLDPQSSVDSGLFMVSQLAYDPLVSVNKESGEIQSQLASDWNVDGTTVTLTLTGGITCSDGPA